MYPNDGKVMYVWASSLLWDYLAKLDFGGKAKSPSVYEYLIRGNFHSMSADPRDNPFWFWTSLVSRVTLTMQLCVCTLNCALFTAHRKHDLSGHVPTLSNLCLSSPVMPPTPAGVVTTGSLSSRQLFGYRKKPEIPRRTSKRLQDKTQQQRK